MYREQMSNINSFSDTSSEKKITHLVVLSLHSWLKWWAYLQKCCYLSNAFGHLNANHQVPSIQNNNQHYKAVQKGHIVDITKKFQTDLSQKVMILISKLIKP